MQSADRDGVGNVLDELQALDAPAIGLGVQYNLKCFLMTMVKAIIFCTILSIKPMVS